MAHNDARYGTTTTLFDDLDVATSEVLAQCKLRTRRQEFLAFLRRIAASVPESLDIHLIVNNYATLRHPKVQAWLVRRSCFHLHNVLTHTFWITQVQRWFGLITQQAIRRGSSCSVKELTGKLNAGVEQKNAQASPFARVATPESILAKIERLCSLTSGTQH